jgi:NAD+ kinase
MKLNRVVIIFKKPSSLHGPSKKGSLARLKNISPDLFRRRVMMQKSHVRTIEHVEKVLQEFKIRYKIISREKLEHPSNPPFPPFLKGGVGGFYFSPPRRGMVGVRGTKADLIITIGGDGTVLAASHVAGKIPILGVNSMPKTSVGFFCAANASSFKQKLSDIRRGNLRFKSLPLLEVLIDGKRLPYLALNDILFAAASPAETVQYTIQVGRRKERQRGSGVWMAAGPGSTAGICSAGGKVTSVASRRIQYLARELYPIPGTIYRLRRGFVSPGKSIRLLSEISDGIAYLDGTKITYPVHRGAVISVRIAQRKLSIFL